MVRILLINPPWARNVEPPLGLGLIQAAIRETARAAGRTAVVRIVDANALAAGSIARAATSDGSTRMHRAILHRDRVLMELLSDQAYRSPRVYTRTMSVYADLLRGFSASHPARITPGDYRDPRFPDYGPDTVHRLVSGPERHPVIDRVMPEIHRAIEAVAPSNIGLSITYRSQFVLGIVLAQAIRRNYPTIALHLGGACLACLPEATIDALTDIGFNPTPGPGEPVFQALTQALTDPDNRPQTPSPGTVRIPFFMPDFTGIDFGRYFAPVPVIPLISSRGCYWSRCRFCDECRDPFEMDEPAAFLARFRRVQSLAPGAMIHITDNAIPPAMLNTLRTQRPGIPWYGFVRPSRELTDRRYTAELAESGCRMLQIGFESPVPAVLERMGKGVDPDWYPSILASLRSAKIRSFAYLMFGFPGQTLEDNRKTIDFLIAHPPDFMNVSIFRMPPGSPLSRELSRESETEGPPVPLTDRLYRAPSVDSVPLPVLRRWIDSEFLDHPAIRSIKQKTPPLYKSSHAAFLNSLEM
ncbi:radical SAM protein [bacterium]|nr:radical SAM protein [candidate division CSSED10-310 bacterium]